MRATNPILQFYILLAQNLSVSCAFYGLVKFYHIVAEDLAWCSPWPKFLCIKGVVFMTFWQGLAISILSGGSDSEGDSSWGKQVSERSERAFWKTRIRATTKLTFRFVTLRYVTLLHSTPLHSTQLHSFCSLAPPLLH